MYRENKLASSVVLFIVIAFVCIALGDSIAYGNWIRGGGRDRSLSHIASNVCPAVVSISSTSVTVPNEYLSRNTGEMSEESRKLFKLFVESLGNGMAEQKSTILGSGFLIDQDGYIVTNYHVIDHADVIDVTIGEGTKHYKAKVVGKDRGADIALLKIDSGKNLPHLSFADSDNIMVGDFVVAVGNPFGLGGTVTSGIVSAKSRSINANAYGDVIQTDAAINVGNSGGPLCDSAGNVIGINSAILSPSGNNIGIGFAITSNAVRPVIEQLKRYGKVERGSLGVYVQEVTDDILQVMKIGEEYRGVLVSKVLADSSAERGGMMDGDIIMEINDQKVSMPAQFVQIISNIRASSKIKLKIYREGKVVILSVVLDKKDNAENGSGSLGVKNEETATYANFVFSSINEDMKKVYGCGEINGVMIKEVENQAEDYNGLVAPGDLVLSINNKKIADMSEFKAMIADIQSRGEEKVMVLLRRGREYCIVVLEQSK